ncbi:peptidoglycan-binding domain-containing protein [Bradyrhizobium arachidis]|uniref:Peptidoglycan-binding protein n=1 Tax=Bradyrhizobium arachidis TaxID=858423 RepID=A0AAE7TFI8_9BRAD|nr:peptidoglycan-binding domain-containing protein [Bradyrhizobium arachidis]QOZ66565.1 peptidoglycan-binding protein [Bradyrhizobium arachidis]SFV19629.1 Putative peptidoglycan binding domain-containing protein [Bradyrhizobium arachidis]
MQELLSPQTLTFLLGLALIVIGIFGGGIEVKEIKIPTLPTLSRALSLAVGIVLVVLCSAFPGIFPKAAVATPSNQTAAPTQTLAALPSPVPTDKPKVWLGAAIHNQIITVHEVKLVLRHVGKYSGPPNDEVNDAYFRAVVEFQLSQNVEADGYVGPITYGKLREAWPEFFEPIKPTK